MKEIFVDVDGPIMEPSDLWLNYIEPEYKDHALKIDVDENGLEYLNVDGRGPSLRTLLRHPS